jgi:hypothetical protein
VNEWREAQEAAAAADAEAACIDAAAAKDAYGSEGGETSSSVRSAQSMSIYKLHGNEARSEFGMWHAKCWGISYAASE